MTGKQRVKEPIEIPCPHCQATAGQKCFESRFGIYQHTFHNARIDAASRLPKAEAPEAKIEVCWCGIEREDHREHYQHPFEPATPPVAEPAPQTFEEWWDAYRPPLSNEQIGWKAVVQGAWNAAKASSPSGQEPTVPRSIAHSLWNEGGRLRTELAASLGMHPENWHKEGLQQRIAEWDKAAERYFDYALSGASSSPAVAGGESETRKEGK